MRVLFTEDVINVANAGEVKEVADGFARNYLLPKRLATIASPEQLKRVARITREGEDRRIKEMGDWQALANLLDGTTLQMTGKVGPTGQFYGAISVTGIIQELASATGHEVERRMVELSEPIRKPGEYPINLRLHQNVAASITVLALGEGQTPEMLAALAEVDEDAVEAAPNPVAQRAPEPESDSSDEDDLDEE